MLFDKIIPYAYKQKVPPWYAVPREAWRILVLQRYAFNLDFPNAFRETCLWGREFNAKSSNSHIFHPSSSLFSLKVWKFRYILLHLHRRTHAGPSSKTMSIQGWRDFAIAEVDLRVVGGTLLNVKASLTLCLLTGLNVGNSRLCVNDNVRSGCYGYGTTVSRGVHVRVFCIPSCTLIRRYVQIPAWADTLLVTHKGFSYGLERRRAEVEAHVLRLGSKQEYTMKVQLGFYGHVYY